MTDPLPPSEAALISASYRDRKFADVERMATDLLGLYPNSATLWRAIWAARTSSNRESSQAALKVAELVPNDHQIQNDCGVSLIGIGKTADAEHFFRRAISINPNFADAYCNLATCLMARRADDEGIVACQQALAINPNLPEAHANLAMLLNRKGDMVVAIDHYQLALKQRPYMLGAHIGLSHSLSKVVPRWHVPMMNEQTRNAAYYAALKSVVTPETAVLEIGTGSGLLAMMAAKLGAKSVTTCESNPLLAETARRIIADNGLSDVIKVINARSTTLRPEDLPERADILVSEIFSSELLGEDVLPSIEDAKRRLIKPNAKIVPSTGSIMCAMFSSRQVQQNIRVDDSFGFNLSRFNEIIPKKTSLLRQDLSIELLSKDIEVFHFDFQNQDYFPARSTDLRAEITRDGTSHGIVQWIRFGMGDAVLYENHPLRPSSVANWSHHAFVFDKDVGVTSGQSVTIRAMHDRKVPWLYLVES